MTLVEETIRRIEAGSYRRQMRGRQLYLVTPQKLARAAQAKAVMARAVPEQEFLHPQPRQLTEDELLWLRLLRVPPAQTHLMKQLPLL